MYIPSLLRGLLAPRVCPPPRTSARPGKRPRSAAAEALERRFLLTTYAVTTAADRGLGSLRDAITQANADTQKDVIEFHIPGAGPHIISPRTPLPDVTSQVTIDG